MWEYPIARAYADARIVKIAGGSIEIMKTIIARQMYSEHGFSLQKDKVAS
jgi:alkylation response protein AidB-like acyl-CoA dehydrogenase